MLKLTMAEFMKRVEAQGVSSPNHYAFICPVCGTVQSGQSLFRAGARPETIERSIAFSCEGRFTGAGPWPSSKDRSAKAVARRSIRGCDWTLGGLFHLHELEIEREDGTIRMAFEIASPEQARALEAWLDDPITNPKR